jgi:acetyl esterase/lipase
MTRKNQAISAGSRLGLLPQYEPELQNLLNTSPWISRESLRPEGILELRKNFVGPSISEITAGRLIKSEEHVFVGYQGAELAITIIMPRNQRAEAPLLFHIHSGGMIAGDRFVGLSLMADFVEEFGVVCSSVEYRLAPEFPDPYPVEDCFAGLQYLLKNAEQLLINKDCIVMVGMSAGGGLAAGVALLARDHGLPKLAGQMLMCPMLDESNASESSFQFDNIGLWDRASNDTGWNALLGNRRHTDEVSIYASPSRADDLSRLPPTFLDTGSLEVFRSEILNYAEALLLAGVATELHIWPGAFHGFDLAFPEARLSRLAVSARREWLRAVLATS